MTAPGVETPVSYTYAAGYLFESAVDPRGNTSRTATYHDDGRLVVSHAAAEAAESIDAGEEGRSG